MPDKCIHNYQQLNSSFNKHFVFHLGVNAGFFSEFNNMVLAMLYCLENDIRFSLYSADANFSFEKGWEDYFLPFSPESKNRFHAKHNQRRHSHVWMRTCNPFFILNKKAEGVDYLTFELWDRFRDRANEKKVYIIPELGIEGDLRTACRQIIRLIWRYNEATAKEVHSLTSSLALPGDYAGMHIRSGDKFTESDLLEVDVYFKKLQEVSSLKDVFILTDNYEVIERIAQRYGEYRIYTLCGQEERGYFHQEFQKRDKMKVKNAHIKLFASVDLLSNANCFIGTFSSNPGMYLGMRMLSDKAFGVDLAQWQIW